MFEGENTPSIAEIAFIAAQKGEYKLLELLLGPSIEAEKKQYIALNAKILGFESHQRLYGFMCSLTEYRLKCISDYMKAPEQYRNIQTLNQDLSEATSKVVEDRVNSIRDQIAISGEHYCVELTTTSLIDLKLDIDNPEAANEEEDNIITFLSRLGVHIPENENIIHFLMTDRLAEEMIQIWHKRFLCRAMKMSLPILRNTGEVIEMDEHLQKALSLYEQKTEEFSKIKIPLSTKSRELIFSYEERIREQLYTIEVYLTGQAPVPSQVCLEYLGEIKKLLQYASFDKEYRHLANSRKIWMPIYTKDNDGNTLAHVAAEAHKYRVIFLLLKYGFDLSIENNHRQTPANLADVMEGKLLILAREYGRSIPSQFLLDQKQLITNYQIEAEQILKSRFKKVVYRIIHNLSILESRVKIEVPRLLEALENSVETSSDMHFVEELVRVSTEARRGPKNKSKLYDASFALIARYLAKDNDHYGVKSEQIEIILAQSRGRHLRDSYNNLEVESEYYENQLAIRGEAVAKLQALNENLAILVRNKDKELSEQQKLIDRQQDELKQMKNEINENKTVVEQTQKEMEHLKSTMERMMLMVQQLQGAAPHSESSQPVPVPAVTEYSLRFFSPTSGDTPTPDEQQIVLPLLGFNGTPE